MLRRTCAALAALLALQGLAPAARAYAQAAEPFPVVPIATPAPRRHTWAYVTMAGGATLVGLSFAFSRKADDAYEAYLVSTDQDEIQRLYDRAVRNDHRAQAALLTGEALVAAGLYLRFIRRPAPKRLSLTLEPSRCALAYRF
jgi:hypothetical protein